MLTKIIFFGSDQYSKIVFKALQADGRWQVKAKFNQRPDVGVIASGPILSSKTLSWPQKGFLNIHPSLLPKYRGPSPGQTAILNGDQKTGVTIIKLVKKVDAGPILHQTTEPIKPDDTSQSLYQRLFTQGAEALIKILPDYLEGKIKLREQDHTQAAYTQKLTRESGRINWQKSAEYNERFVRAMFPWPGAWTNVSLDGGPAVGGDSSKVTYGLKRLKILKAHLKNKKLVLDQVQLEGKKPVTWKQFCEGHPAKARGPAASLR